MSLPQREAAVRRPLAFVNQAARRLTPLCVAALVSACGGGSDSTSTTASISSMSAATAVLKPGLTTNIIVRGTGLAGATVSLTGCSSVRETSRGSIVAVFECTVGSAEDIVAMVNGQPSGKSLAIPRVDSIAKEEAGAYMFGALTKFIVRGHGLDQGLKPDSDACNEIVISSVTSDVMKFDCFISAKAGTVGVLAADSTPFDPTVSIDAPNPPRVTITLTDNTSTPATTRTLTVELDSTNAPISTYNFLRYANVEFYNGTIFHRVVNSSIKIIQGGYFVGKSDAELTVGSDQAAFLSGSSTIPLESTQTTGLSNIAGTIAMARGDDADSAQAQFYFNTGDNSALFDYVDDNDPGYAVFGRVIGSNDLSTLTTLEGVTTKTLTDGTPNVPEKDIVIKSVVQTQ